MSYYKKLNSRAYKGCIDINEAREQAISLIKNLEDFGWVFQLFASAIYKECGVYELYESNDRFNGRFVSDAISDAFYQSSSLDEFYDKLNYILLQLESHL